MTIFPAWKDSLRLLKPSSLKLFGLVTLKGIIQTYSSFFKYVLPVLVLLAGIYLGVFVIFPEYKGVLNIIFYLIWVTGSFLIYAAARPSVLPKSYSYFRAFGCALLFFFIFDLCANYLANLLNEKIGQVGSILTLFSEPLVVSPLYGFFILFFLDSYTSVKNLFISFKRASVMAWYNYPICLLIFVLFLAIFNGISDLFVFMVAKLLGYQATLQLSSLGFSDAVLMEDSEILNYLYIARFYFDLLLLPLFASVITAFYVKRVHEDFKRYE